MSLRGQRKVVFAWTWLQQVVQTIQYVERLSGGNPVWPPVVEKENSSVPQGKEMSSFTLILDSWAEPGVLSRSLNTPPAAAAYTRKNRKDICDGSMPKTALLLTPISSFSSVKKCCSYTCSNNTCSFWQRQIALKVHTASCTFVFHMEVGHCWPLKAASDRV